MYRCHSIHIIGCLGCELNYINNHEITLSRVYWITNVWKLPKGKSWLPCWLVLQYSMYIPWTRHGIPGLKTKSQTRSFFAFEILYIFCELIFRLISQIKFFPFKTHEPNHIAPRTSLVNSIRCKQLCESFLKGTILH